MATKKRKTKKKSAKRRSSGLAKYRTFVNKKTAVSTRKVKELERRLTAAKKEKARKAKAAAAAFKRKRK